MILCVILKSIPQKLKQVDFNCPCCLFWLQDLFSGVLSKVERPLNERLCK